MTDEHYRAINRALCLIEGDEIDEFQDIREAARTALHHIFGREKKLRIELAGVREFYESGNDKRADRAEIAKLRAELDLKDGVLNQAKGELDRLREDAWRWCNERDEAEAELAKLREERDEAERRAQVNLEDANRGWAELAKLRAELALLTVHHAKALKALKETT